MCAQVFFFLLKMVLIAGAKFAHVVAAAQSRGKMTWLVGSNFSGVDWGNWCKICLVGGFNPSEKY
jgi:hypothetical protein